MNLDVPGVFGVFPGFDETSTSLFPRDATRLWPACPPLWTVGRWRPGEMRTVSCADARLVVIGQCLASNQQLCSDLAKAVSLDRLELVTRWPGSYLAIVIRAEDLTAFVDLAGQFPLYYRSTGGRTLFGTQATATARAAGVYGRPDLLSLAAQIFCPTVPALTEDRSAFDGLSRLGGGDALRITRHGTCTRWAYESLSPDYDMSLTDGAEALRAALEAAVQLRTASGSRVTADFSGGLDSTSVAFLAARQDTKPIDVFTYHNPETPADDLVHARRYAELDQRIRQNLLRGTNETLTYQALNHAVVTDLPDPGAVVRARTRMRLRHVAASGTEFHLNGEGADALLAVSPAYLGDLARRRAFLRLRRDYHLLARERRVSPLTVLAKAARLSLTSPQRALHKLANDFERPVNRDTSWIDTISWWPAPATETAWLTKKMRAEIAGLLRAKADAVRPSGALGISDFIALTELRVSGAVQRQLSEAAREFGVWPQAPFLDNDVIRACMMLPAYRRADARLSKPLLGKALAGLVPDAVLSRRTKGNYTAEDYRGARQAAGELRLRVARLRLAQAGVVDSTAVMASLDKALAGLRSPFPAFNRLLGVDLWLEGLDSR